MFQSSRKPDLVIPPNPPIAPDPRHAAVSPARAAAVLSSGVSIKGDVTFRDELVIDGEVEGTIKSGGVLIIGQHAHISAEITAGSVTIQGTVNGNVLAFERCAVEADATVRGDIETPRLALAENATFLGNAKIAAERA
jgi:cytoskeletal protein CcmA (bactofilin family)